MNTNSTDRFDAPRRGRRKGQAKNDVEASRKLSPDGHALIAALGEDMVDRKVELLDCVAIARHCPDRAPEKIPPALVNVAWRMLRALKKNDQNWFERRLAVRDGKAYAALVASDAPRLSDMAEPDRAVLASLVRRQQAGALGPLSEQELADHVTAAQAEDDDTPIPTTKTLGKKFEAMGGFKNRKRGRKSRRE